MSTSDVPATHVITIGSVLHIVRVHVSKRPSSILIAAFYHRSLDLPLTNINERRGSTDHVQIPKLVDRFGFHPIGVCSPRGKLIVRVHIQIPGQLFGNEAQPLSTTLQEATTSVSGQTACSELETPQALTPASALTRACP